MYEIPTHFQLKDLPPFCQPTSAEITAVNDLGSIDDPRVRLFLYCSEDAIGIHALDDDAQTNPVEVILFAIACWHKLTPEQGAVANEFLNKVGRAWYSHIKHLPTTKQDSQNKSDQVMDFPQLLGLIFGVIYTLAWQSILTNEQLAISMKFMAEVFSPWIADRRPD
ncbi:MAG: hypothetical protein WCT37_01450 [Patescibacteria group bacterium]|jgi:hypothetical protein